MLISSHFKDYYDFIKSFGIDKTVVYDRTQSTHKINEYSTSYKERIHWPGKDVTYDLYEYVIGFCGKLYPVLEFRLYVSGGYRSQFFYDYTSVEKFLDSRGMKKGNYDSYWRNSTKKTFDVNEWFKLNKYFQEFKVPCFIFGRMGDDYKDVLLLNPQLKNFQFFKIRDSASTFQELYMYISGVLGTSTRPAIKLSDKEIAKKRGHDGKYSFRKPPGDKKGKRR